jgi:hypothetical protein
MAVLLARGQITIAAIKDGADGAQGPQGKPGKDGVDGEAAVSILVEDAPLIFDTNDNGIVPVSIGKVAKVKVMKGNQNISNRCSNISSRDDLCVNCKCGAIQKDGYIEVNVSGSNIAKNGVVIDGVNRGNVSATSGYAVVQLTYNGVTYFAQVPFSANVAKFTGVVAFDNKSYKSQFEEVSKRLDGAVTQDELTQAKSEIEQTAREISLSVSEKSIARRNLLVGSDFRKQTNDFIISNDARIEMNSGYQGTNCIKAIDVTEAGNAHYVGVYWDGSQGGKSVRIEKGKKYILSCYFKTNDTNAKLHIEAIYTDKVTNAKRIKRATYITPAEFAPKNVYEWQLCTAVIDTKDAASDYIAFNFWEYCLVDSGQIESYICRPMVEEGNTYNGWTLSDKDYDYVGANLIDNSRTLDAGGNVIEAKGQKTLVGDAYELTASGIDDYNTFYRIKGSTFKLNTDYTISFEVRGDAKYMGVYVSYPITNTKFTCYKELQNGAMTEVGDDGKTVGYVALVEVKELSKQQRVWGHFRFKDRLPEELYFQFPKNAKQTDVTSWNVTITKPKIEEGAVVTEYTERKTDVVEKTKLKAAGININKDYVEIYGDKVKVSQTEGGKPIALFGSNGKINGSFIETNNLFLTGFMYKCKNTKPVYTNYPFGSKAQYIDIPKSGSWLEMCPFDTTFKLPCTKLVEYVDYSDGYYTDESEALFKEENNLARSLVGSTVIIYNVPSQYDGREFDMRIESTLMPKSNYYKWMANGINITYNYDIEGHVTVKCGQMISLECICSRYQSSLKNANGIFEDVWTERVIWLYEIVKYSKWGVGNN